jgi:hypothetical protein
MGHSVLRKLAGAVLALLFYLTLATVETGNGGAHHDRLDFCPFATLHLIETLQSADVLRGSPGSKGFLAVWTNHEKQLAVVPLTKFGRNSGRKINTSIAIGNPRLKLLYGQEQR